MDFDIARQMVSVTYLQLPVEQSFAKAYKVFVVLVFVLLLAVIPEFVLTMYGIGCGPPNSVGGCSGIFQISPANNVVIFGQVIGKKQEFLESTRDYEIPKPELVDWSNWQQ